MSLNMPNLTGVPANNKSDATGFVNLSFPSATESGKTKLGKGVAMSPDKAVEKYIGDMYEQFIAAGQTADQFNAWLKDNLIVEYRPWNKNGASVNVAGVTVPDFLRPTGS